MRMPSRFHRYLRTISFAFALLVLNACAAPAPNGNLQADADAAKDSSAAVPASAASAPATTGAAAQEERKPDKPMRTGGPLPAEKVSPKGAKPVELDFSCKSDADCEVKNVGNCCGYYPACVNRNSPTDPEGVQAQCAKSGMMSVCGWADISSCSCKQGKCAAESNQVTE